MTEYEYDELMRKREEALKKLFVCAGIAGLLALLSVLIVAVLYIKALQ